MCGPGFPTHSPFQILELHFSQQINSTNVSRGLKPFSSLFVFHEMEIMFCNK